MARGFDNRSAARQWVWDRLSAEGLARFPFPPHGRIPNFAGAEVAAARLLDIEPWKSATAVKVNPDSPQRPLRAEALRRGITVFVPTPRLRGGFKKLDPCRIPPDKIEEATSLSRGNRWSEEVASRKCRSSTPSSAAPSRSHVMGGPVARAKATATSVHSPAIRLTTLGGQYRRHPYRLETLSALVLNDHAYDKLTGWSNVIPVVPVKGDATETYKFIKEESDGTRSTPHRHRT